MFCFPIQPAADGGLLDAIPALVCLGGAVELLLAATLVSVVPLELETMGAVVGWAEEMDTPLLEG